MSVIGIDVGGTYIKGALRLAEGTIQHKLAPLPTEAEQGPDHVVERIQTAVARLVDSAPPGDPLQGIGIGIPGGVDHARGTVLHPPNFPGWTEINLGERIAGRWNVPALVENDANCAALGESEFGAGRPYRNFIGLTLGTGVGSGIILDNHIFRGEKGYAGEFGHIVIDFKGEPCNCGNIGCIEAYLGNTYMTRRAVSVILNYPDSFLYDKVVSDPDSLTPKDLSEAAEQGDKLAAAIIHENGSLLGIAISSAANLMDVDVFIIGGGVAAAGKLLFDGIIESATSRSMKVHRDHLVIIPAMLGNDAGMLGAASLFL